MAFYDNGYRCTLFGSDLPAPLSVPVHHDGSVAYVRMSEIAEPARSAFERRMQGATQPVIAGELDAVYAWDWLDFIGGPR